MSGEHKYLCCDVARENKMKKCFETKARCRKYFAKSTAEEYFRMPPVESKTAISQVPHGDGK